MRCIQCGSENAPGAKFCAVCGSSLGEDITSQQGNSQYQENYDGETVLLYEDGYSGGYVDNSPGAPPQQPVSNTPYQRPVNNMPYQQQMNSAPYQQQMNGAPYRQPAPWQNAPQMSAQQASGRSAGAVVLYIIAGILALAAMGMTALPSLHFSLGNSGFSFGSSGFNVFQYGIWMINGGSMLSSYRVSVSQETIAAGIVVIAMFVIPMIFQLIWAILSFARRRPAGAMGLVGSILYTLAASYWTISLMNPLTSMFMTYVPYIMVALGIAGIVVSSIQIAKRNRVR